MFQSNLDMIINLCLPSAGAQEPPSSTTRALIEPWQVGCPRFHGTKPTMCGTAVAAGDPTSVMYVRGRGKTIGTLKTSAQSEVETVTLGIRPVILVTRLLRRPYSHSSLTGRGGFQLFRHCAVGRELPAVCARRDWTRRICLGYEVCVVVRTGG